MKKSCATACMDDRYYQAGLIKKLKMFYQTQTACRPPKGPENAVLSLVTFDL